MSLLNILSRFSTAEATEQLAQETAHACRDRVWQRVVKRAGTMSPAEARGYLRVRGARLLADAAREHVARHPQTSRTQPQRVAALANERLTRELIDMMIKTPTATAHRRAA